MSGVPAPGSGVLPYLQEASQGTGLPLQVVEAQNLAESAYGTNLGPSSAGAEGPWQFLPSTYASVGGQPGGINQWGPSTKAYITYMNELLKQEGGSIFKALEAYNAGPGNLPAGAGYASSILASAGVSSGATAGKGNPTLTGITIPNPIAPGLLPGINIGGGSSGGGIFSGIWTDLGNTILQTLGIPDFKDLLERLGLILLGAVLLFIGVNMLTKGVVSKVTSSPQPVQQETMEPSSEPVEETSTGTVADSSGTSPEFRKQFLGESVNTGLVDETLEAAVAALWPDSSTPSVPDCTRDV